jgi:hypothetical protein
MKCYCGGIMIALDIDGILANTASGGLIVYYYCFHCGRLIRV